MARWIEEADRKTSCSRCHTVIDVGQRFYFQRRGVYLCELDGSLAEHEVPDVGEVESGVLEDLSLLPASASTRTLAKAMLKTAKLIDSGEVADRDIAPLLKELRTQLIQLQLQFPAEPEDDDTEKARKRLEQRLTGDREYYE